MRGSDLRPRTLSSGLNVAPLGISTGTTRWEFPYRNIDDGQIVRGCAGRSNWALGSWIPQMLKAVATPNV